MPYLVSQGVQGVARDLNQIILPAGYWDLAALGTTTQTGGVTSGAGPLGRGFNDLWQATATGQALTVDLGASYQLIGVSFGTSWRLDASQIPSAYAIDYSTDNVTFTNLATVTGNGTPSVTHLSLLSGVPQSFNARYIRVTINAFQASKTESQVSGLQIWSGQYAAGFGNAPWLVDANGNVILKTGGGLNVPTAGASVKRLLNYVPVAASATNSPSPDVTSLTGVSTNAGKTAFTVSGLPASAVACTGRVSIDSTNSPAGNQVKLHLSGSNAGVYVDCTVVADLISGYAGAAFAGGFGTYDGICAANGQLYYSSVGPTGYTFAFSFTLTGYWEPA